MVRELRLQLSAEMADSIQLSDSPSKGAGPVSGAALRVLTERYFWRNEAGEVVEDLGAMFGRVARAIAEPSEAFGESAAYWEERFRRRLERLEFLPNSPTLMNAGRKGGQLAACFVLPVEDDLDSIFSTLGRMARIHQSGGGTGFSFSHLRPRDDRVQSTGGTSTGPLSFIDLFDATTAVICAGRRRRGACMAVLRVDHPDIEEYIAAKRTPGRLENFNLSVGLTDAYLSALDAAESFPLRNPRTGSVVRLVDPGELFESIIDAAWACGDPGLLFLDEINRHNPTPQLGEIEATNPCGEQPLLAWESCTLGSLNLAAFASSSGLDWESFGAAIDDAVVFLDNVIEATEFPCAEIAAATRRTRKIGLGIMGLADLLARLRVAYDSQEGVALGGRIAQAFSARARAASAALGERRGSFPAFGQSIWPARGYASLRHAATTCVAPTGTLALIAGVESGIEPFFALATARRVLGEPAAVEVHPSVADALQHLGGARDAAMAAVRASGSFRGVEQVPESIRRSHPIALEIAPEDHLCMQAAFQGHVDAAVSKTVNLPASASRDQVRRIFLLARQLRLKGVTVYRYGSRPGQSLSLLDGESHPLCGAPFCDAT